ncbi:Calcium-binding protein [Balamuthia mandrillaris]
MSAQQPKSTAPPQTSSVGKRFNTTAARITHVNAGSLSNNKDSRSKSLSVAPAISKARHHPQPNRTTQPPKRGHEPFDVDTDDETEPSSKETQQPIPSPSPAPAPVPASTPAPAPTPTPDTAPTAPAPIQPLRNAYRYLPPNEHVYASRYSNRYEVIYEREPRHFPHLPPEAYPLPYTAPTQLNRHDPYTAAQVIPQPSTLSEPNPNPPAAAPVTDGPAQSNSSAHYSLCWKFLQMIRNREITSTELFVSVAYLQSLVDALKAEGPATE